MMQCQANQTWSMAGVPWCVGKYHLNVVVFCVCQALKTFESMCYSVNSMVTEYVIRGCTRNNYWCIVMSIYNKFHLDIICVPLRKVSRILR